VRRLGRPGIARTTQSVEVRRLLLCIGEAGFYKGARGTRPIDSRVIRRIGIVIRRDPKASSHACRAS